MVLIRSVVSLARSVLFHLAGPVWLVLAVPRCPVSTPKLAPTLLMECGLCMLLGARTWGYCSGWNRTEPQLREVEGTAGTEEVLPADAAKAPLERRRRARRILRLDLRALAKELFVPEIPSPTPLRLRSCRTPPAHLRSKSRQAAKQPTSSHRAIPHVGSPCTESWTKVLAPAPRASATPTFARGFCG